MVIDVTKVNNFYNGGLWGNFSFFVRAFVSDNIKKNVMKISSRNKKVITKKCLTNLYEMNSSPFQADEEGFEVNLVGLQIPWRDILAEYNNGAKYEIFM